MSKTFASNARPLLGGECYLVLQFIFHDSFSQVVVVLSWSLLLFTIVLLIVGSMV
jgi:hypothetical protein